ncbi:MAG: YdeI/OmpD-associated family protein [Dehalococcoidales bacterium]|nr:YdeI/OmpD-associated family protein [Dehalococcoidales bacterium]
MANYKILHFETRADWRHWLEENHAKEDGVWLIHYNKQSGKGGLSHTEAMEEALAFGWIDSVLRKNEPDSFLLKYTPRRKNSLWSKINKDKAEKLIADGKMTPAGMAQINIAKQNGLWDKAYTLNQTQIMPPDLAKALKTDEAAWQNFRAFAPGYRNLYIHWVNDAKTTPTRNKRILIVVRRAKANKKVFGTD